MTTLKRLLSLAVVLAAAIMVFAANVTCPIHDYASCYDTGTIAVSGAHKWHCSCGHDVFVKSR
jgi:hypothetical protein